MSLPPVLIVANPYEAELCKKALAPTGIEVAITDGGDDLPLLLPGKKLAVVVASGLYLSEADEVIRSVQSSAPEVPVLLLADDEHELSGIAVRQRFFRPVDAEELAHAIERIAVELEAAEDDGSSGDDSDDDLDIVVDAPEDDTLAPQPIPRMPTERLDNVDEPPAIVDHLTPPISGTAATNHYLPLGSDPEPSGPMRLGSLMRADEALLDALPAIEPSFATDDEEPTRALRYPHVPDRPTPVFSPSLPQSQLNGDLQAFAKSPLLDDIDLDAIDTGAPRPIARGPQPLPALIDAQTTRAQRFEEPPAAPAPTNVIGPDDEGDLQYVDIAELLSRLSQLHWNGRLLVERSDGGKSIFFEEGLPVAATSDFASDRLGDILYRDGKLNRDQHARTRQLSPAHGKSGANALCEVGLLKQREIFALLRRHTEEVFYSLFAWEAGTYRMRQQVAPPEDRVRPGQSVGALVLEGIRRKYSLERLSELVGPIETVLSPTTELQRVASELHLLDGEKRVVELLDGERSLKDIQFAERGLPGGLTEPGLYAFVWFLLCGGALRVGEGHDAGLAGDVRGLPTQVTPASVGRVRDRRERGRDDGSADSDADRAIERERILAKLDQLGDADYFSILGVERHATSHEIRRAYERLAADFAKPRFSPAMQTELDGALTEIGYVLQEAYRVLADEALRSSYRGNLID